MLIDNLHESSEGPLRFLRANAHYEGATPRSVNLEIAVKADHASMLRPGYEPFLLGCFSAALFHGEQRIHVDGGICPYLANNVRAALLLQKHWWCQDRAVPVLSAAALKADLPADGYGGSACFLSGGVDSTSMVLANRQNFPEGHPFRFRYGFLAYGLDIGDPNRKPAPELFERAVETLRPFAEAMDMQLVPVWTNMRDIEHNGRFYETLHFVGLLSGLSHAAGKTVARCSISNDSASQFIEKWASHPQLNSLMASSFQYLVSEQAHLTRFQKVGLIAESPAALASLRVCYNTEFIDGKYVNCGKCEKCTRTKLMLLALGISDPGIFPDNAIDKDLLRSVDARYFPAYEFYHELPEALEQQGHHELAGIVRYMIEDTRPIARLKKFFGRVAGS